MRAARTFMSRRDTGMRPARGWARNAPALGGDPGVLVVSAALLFAALPAQTAQATDHITCAFTTECYDTEACAETSYDIDLHRVKTGWLLSDVAGERPLQALPVQDAEAADTGLRAFASPVIGAQVNLLSVHADGTGQYTTHGTGPYMVHYLGRCQETN